MSKLPHNLRVDDRGVASSVGYVLLLGVMFTSITSVVLLGAPAIDDRERQANLDSTLSGFEILTDQINEVGTGDTSTRSSELPVQDGAVFSPGEYVIRVDVTTNGGTETTVFASTPVSYTGESTQIHYESGAVIHVTDGVPSMRTQPPWVFKNERVVLPITRTTVRPSQKEIAGKRSIPITVTSERPRMQFITHANTATVKITVSSSRHEAWKRYFEDIDSGVVTANESAETATIEYDTQSVYVRESVVIVESSE